MNEITVQDSSDGFLVTNTLQDALKVADIIAKSSFCPKGFLGKPGDILVCMQMGKELGLKPLQALQNIAVINGKPSLWGDAMLAVCRQASNYDYVDETFDAASMTATCKAKRHNEPEVVRTFSQEDAKKASLWGKQGPWSQYPARMLQMRARGFCLRDAFPDALRGMISAEEAKDYPSKPAEKEIKSNVVADIIARKKEPKKQIEVEVISEAELDIVELKVHESKADIVALCKYYQIGCLDMLPKSELPKLLSQLDKKMTETNVVDEFFEGEKA